MIYPTFSEWWDSLGNYQRRVSYEDAARGWVARDAEIADLKRLLAEREQGYRQFMGLLLGREYAETGSQDLRAALDAYVQEKVEGKRHEGANWMLDEICGSLRGYPHQGGDIEVMGQVDRIVAEAVLAESEAMLTHKFGVCRDARDSVMCAYCDRVAANRAKVK